MVKVALCVTCRLDNIEELKPSGPEFRWCLKFICCNCSNKSEKWNYLSLDESMPLQRGNGVCHFICKCKFCSRENSVTIIEDSIKSFTKDDEGKFKTIVVFDCRGIEPDNFSAGEGWVAKAANGGKEFNDVDLDEGEWEDYCDKIMEPVGIYEFQHRFQKMK
ncbi:PREDICTED: UPF0587 protein C1orf123 homolog [Cyphomyrmex costatus]|uniref:Uncharacterized protein n=1 Tax=Cyphomyrmex costatus TaxID=456900 RepID=A0A151I8C4_9HYME|nr:PREDICTED: UPF0587 protein C1orf123 homolog [Cyphomyrmex costatus]KYM94378.1 hypothetical protein ALC62_14993 [Cyphomyrmex costatus]